MSEKNIFILKSFMTGNCEWRYIHVLRNLPKNKVTLAKIIMKLHLKVKRDMGRIELFQHQRSLNKAI